MSIKIFPIDKEVLLMTQQEGIKGGKEHLLYYFGTALRVKQK
jgi:hypothetical protein